LFSGEKGAIAPIFGPRLYSTYPKRGLGEFESPQNKYKNEFRTTNNHQFAAICRNLLQFAAICCNLLQFATICRNSLQFAAIQRNSPHFFAKSMHILRRHNFL